MKKNLLLFTFMFFITLLASNSVIAQCTYGAPTVVATVAAPTTVGATITSPAMTSGQVYRVTGMVSGAVYRVYNCGSGFDTQITIYPSGGGTSEGYNDDNGPECTGAAASINYTCALSGTKDIKLNLYNCLSSGNPGTITVRLVSMPFVPCIASTNQGVITPTGTYQMTASVPAGAAHYWSATLTAGVSYTFSNCVAEGGTAEDTYLRIYDATGAVVATADDVCSTNALVIYTPGTTGTYYIGLTHYSCSFLSLSQKISYRITPFDPCSSITASNACGVTNTTVIGAGSDGVYNPPATSCGYSTPGREKIYTFTPSTSGLHQIAQSASFYYIDYFFKASSGGCTGTGWTCIKDLNGAATSATATFVLTAGTQYYILLDPENSAGGTVSFSIVCPAACGTPTSAAATSVTTTTATANWTCASCTGTYIIEYGLTGFTPGTGAGAGSGSSTVVTAIAGATSKGLTGLTSGSNYQYYVRQVCSGPLYSSNSTVQAFSTPLYNCDYTVPSTGNNAITTCSGTICDPGGGGDYAINQNGYTVINPTAGNLARITGVTSAGESCCDYVNVYDGTGTGGTLLGNYPMGTAIPQLTSSAGALTIQFYSDVSLVGAGFSATISCIPAPTCSTPVSAAATSITSTTATANWTCASCTGTYIIEYGITGFTPGTGAGAGSGSSTVVTAIAGATSKGLTGLTSSSNYQYYIRQVCSGPLYSSNSTVRAFSTPAAPPANDNVCSATALAVTGVSPYNNSFGPYSNAGSTTEVGEPAPPATGYVTQTGWGVNDISNTIWFALTVPACGTYSIETDNFDTQIALYSAASCSAVLAGGTTLLAANDDESSIPYDSKIIDVALQPGVTYYLQLDSYTAGVTGSTPIKVTGVASAIPAITSATAVSPYVCPGATTTLNANNVGGAGAVVTWWTGMNGTGTNLGTGASLPGMGTGTYYARVTGDCSPPIEASVTVNGLDPAMATVPASDGTTRTADKECSDGTWTDYYQGNNILLSIKKNGQTIGTVGDGNFFVRQKGSSGFSPISNLWPDNYCNTTNWKVMNRYWDVTTVTQPAAGVNVRFYYTTADYDAVKNALAVATPPRTLTSHSQLLFYKINDLIPSGYNIDPTGGHTNIPIATGYGADGYYEYLHGGTPGTAAWTYSAFGAAHYGEYTVSKFSGGGGGGGNSGGAFPIELLYFSGHAEANTNIIEWATATEKNNQYQIVERSVNGIDDWTEVGRKAGAGNSTDPIAYKLSDAAPLALGYYRLRAVDFDGTEQLSEVISIQRESDVFAIVNAFPVPVDKEVTLLVNTPVSGDVDIMVTDIIGKLLYKSSTTLTKGVNEVKIDMETLPAGTYTITLDNGKARAMKQIVK